MSEVRIQLTDHGRGDVFIDGQRVEGVRDVTVTASASKGRRLNQVHLTLIPKKLTLEGIADVTTVDAEAQTLMHVPV